MTLLDLEPILNSTVDGLTKGLPPDLGPTPLHAIGRKGWSLLKGDLPVPAGLIRQSALDHNAAWMRDFTAASGVKLAPHGKTTMSPQLLDRQLAAGAWGVTVANAHQFGVYRRFGARRFIIANQLVDPVGIRTVLAALAADPGLEVYTLADSLAGVALLAQAPASANRLRILVELGITGGRTGARTVEAALEVARAVKAAQGLDLVGVEGFEGILKQAAPVQAFADDLARLAESAGREGLFASGPVILTAGGSAFFDIMAARLREVRLDQPTMMVIRSGCYLTHDSAPKDFAAIQERLGPSWANREGLRPALEIWGAVQSCPEPGLALLTMGKRDCSFDVDLPVPQHWFARGRHDRPIPVPAGAKITALNDQHAYLKLPEGWQPAVGDLVGCGIVHPCTTFDRWALFLVVDDDYRVVDAVRTYF